MDEQQLRKINAIWDNAMWTMDSDDQVFALILLMDPDGSIGQAIHQLEEADWQRERAAMTEEQRQAIDEAAERGIKRGMERVRRLLVRSSDQPA